MLRVDRQRRIRKRLAARSDRPRLSVFRSLKFIYGQIIDDKKGITLASARGKDPATAGKQLAETAKAKKITQVVFDRGPYQYHGRIRLLAEAARKGGLEF